MSGSVNKVILVGRLTRDPEAKETGGGTITRLGLATNESWTDRNGQKQERTEFHNITAFGPLADTCARYLSKGRQVYVEGSLQTDEYTDRDGNQRKSTGIKAKSIQFLSGGEQSQSQPRQSQRSQQNFQGGW
tara:strand:- start:2958 stop:3353 length:396 start_codon:yes stop_codon:yes gene_type:complete